LMITGILLEVIAKKHKQLYELYLNRINKWLTINDYYFIINT
jgi:hypothetical protein